MKRGSLNWIITNDVMRILGDRYDTSSMFARLSTRYNALRSFGKSTPQIRVGLVNLASDIALESQKTVKEINP